MCPTAALFLIPLVVWWSRGGGEGLRPAPRGGAYGSPLPYPPHERNGKSEVVHSRSTGTIRPFTDNMLLLVYTGPPEAGTVGTPVAKRNEANGVPPCPALGGRPLIINNLLVACILSAHSFLTLGGVLGERQCAQGAGSAAVAPLPTRSPRKGEEVSDVARVGVQGWSGGSGTAAPLHGLPSSPSM